MQQNNAYKIHKSIKILEPVLHKCGHYHAHYYLINGFKASCGITYRRTNNGHKCCSNIEGGIIWELQGYTW